MNRRGISATSGRTVLRVVAPYTSAARAAPGFWVAGFVLLIAHIGATQGSQALIGDG
jgi:hypothetical protein